VQGEQLWGTTLRPCAESVKPLVRFIELAYPAWTEHAPEKEPVTVVRSARGMAMGNTQSLVDIITSWRVTFFRHDTAMDVLGRSECNPKLKRACPCPSVRHTACGRQDTTHVRHGGARPPPKIAPHRAKAGWSEAGLHVRAHAHARTHAHTHTSAAHGPQPARTCLRSHSSGACRPLPSRASGRGMIAS
jgi:hypothetical protein